MSSPAPAEKAGPDLVWVRSKKDEWRIAKVISNSLTDDTVTVESQDAGSQPETFAATDTHVYDVIQVCMFAKTQ